MTVPHPSGRRPAVSHGAELPDDPKHPRTLGEALTRAAERFPEAGLHLVAADGGTDFLAHPDLLDRARAVRDGLRARNVDPGGYAILRVGASVEYWPAFFGCVLAGVVPLTTAAGPGHTGESPALDALRHAWRTLGEPVVVAGTADAAGLRHLPLGGRVVTVAELADGHRPAPDTDHHAVPEEVAVLQLSSGSTGTPKIIPLTHLGLSQYAVGAREMLDIRPGDVLLNWLPVDHVAGLLLYHLGGVFLGATSVHVDTERVLADPLRWLELMRRHRVTHSWAPNFGLRLVADAVARDPGRRWELRHVRRMVSGGEQCRPETFDAFVATTGVPAAAMTPAWGMSETSTAITFASLGEPGCRQRVRAASLDGDLEWATADDGPADCVEFLSVGAPAPGAALRIVDRDDEVLPEGRIGRLQVRSPRLTPGYLADPEATRAALRPGGWWDTGDLAYMVDGRITVTGREKDLIIINGHNLPCHEVEQVAGEVSGVAAGLVAAAGVPDPRTGTESLVLFHVPDADAGRPASEVARDVTAALARRWGIAPARVVAVPEAEFPRTTGGKIQRAALRRRLTAGDFDTDRRPVPAADAPTFPVPAADAPSSPVPAGSPVAPRSDGHAVAPPARATVRRAVLDALGDLLGGPVDTDRPFWELGIGSVEIVRLRARLEQALGRPVPPPAFFAHPTIDALVRHLTDAAPADATGPAPVGPDHRIAVIGMAGRFPGAADVDEFWSNLLAGVESVRFFTPEELAAARVPDADAPGFVAASGVLDDVTGFDAGFFGISAREAELLDPQHRLFLETCQHALEDAGYAGAGDRARVGLFAGGGMNLYTHHTYLRNNLDAATRVDDPATSVGTALGNQPDFLATRVAYRLGLTGPAVTVQTACSTSLVAVHLAARSLLTGDADLAVAGAVAVHVPQVTGYRHTPGSILSARGRCRPFDAAADGTVGGNGVAAVVLKPYARAVADGDPVYAVILGSAVNNDGAGKVGFTAPSVTGQVEVIRQALRDAAVPASSIGYVEAHGTGTALGDPVEHHALAEAYASARPFLGSVKANIGHLDSCAGLAGLVKAVLAVRTGRIPPQINFTRPAVDLAPFTVSTTGVGWSGSGTPRRAAVSALGVGGTNAHVIVEQPPGPVVAPAATAPSATASAAGVAAAPTGAAPPGTRPGVAAPGLLPLSAADPAALTALAIRHRDHLRTHPDLALADLVTTTGRGRRHLRHRLVARGGSPAALASALDRFVAGTAAPDTLVTGTAAAGPVVLAFPGQGDLRPVLLPLADRFPVVRDVLAEAASAYRDAVGGDLLARLRDAPDPAGPATDLVQPVLVVVGLALAELWRSWGVTPDYVLGHSVGEYTALAVAGALPFADAVRLAAWRGRLMHDELGPGAMLAVLAERTVVDDLVAGTPVEVAVVNGPDRHVLAGSPDEVSAVAARAARLGLSTRRLPVGRAFHTSAVEPLRDRLRELAGRVDLRPVRVPVVSTVDGRVREPGWRPDAEHLYRQARGTVEFHAAVRTAVDRDCRTFVEAGPEAALTRLARAARSTATWIPSQRRGLDPVDGVWQAVAELHCAGAPVDWVAVTEGCAGRRVSLPGYPFQRRRYWIDAHPAPASGSAPTPAPAAGSAPTLAPTSAPTSASASAGAGDLAASSGTVDGAVLDRVRALTAGKLGLEVPAVGPDETFFSLGADSLLLISMSREIDQAYGVRVPIRELFEDVDTPRRLAERIIAGSGSSRAEAAPPSPGLPSPPPSPATPSPATPLPAAPQDAASRAVGGLETPPDTASRVDQDGGGRPGPAMGGGPVGEVTPGSDLSAIIHRQLDLMQQQLALLGAAGATTPTAVTVERPVRTAPARVVSADPVDPGTSTQVVGAGEAGETVDVSLYFFGDYPDQRADDRYGLILDAAQYADTHGFHAVWFPERHFHSFGGIFPNPSVLAAALAVRTERIRLNAGSVVLPLHHPVRVAEEWSMVDNLSDGRIGLGCAPGWHANDFVFQPENFGRHKQVMYEHLETVRRLWRGDAVPATSGSGDPVDVRLFPRPVQDVPPFFTAIVGNPDSYREAARRDVGVVTNLMTQDVAQLAENIALYRRTRAEHGLDPAAGRVVVLLHTYLGDDLDRVREAAFDPFCAYLRSSFSLLGQVVNSLGMSIDLADTPDEDVRFVLSRAYRRYCEQRALIGTPESCRPVLDAVLDAGADEIACFVDFGLPAPDVRAGLPFIDVLRRATPRRPAAPQPVREEIAPLTPGQRRLWLVEQLHPGTPAYTEAVAVRLRGPLDVAALRGALGDVVARHAPLRTTYREVDGEPCQVVRPVVPVELPVRDLTGRAEEPAVAEAMAGESRRVFDLAEGPVFAFTLLRLSADHHVLVLAFHHLSTDGGSYAVLTREVSVAYRARVSGSTPELAALPVDYPELARAAAGRRAAVDDGDLGYWLARFDPPPPTLVLPSDLPRPALPSPAGRSVFTEVPAELAARIRRFSGVERVTPFTTLLSAFGVMLFRFSGQPDLVVGTGFDGRHERTADLVGFFVDTLPLRLDLTGDPTFREILTRVRAAAADAYEHAAVPFDALVRALAPHREAGRHPLFDVVVEYETGGAFAFDLPGVTAEPLPVGLDKAPVDLMVYLSHTDTVRCHVEYRTEVFDPVTVRRLLDHWVRLLDGLTREPDVPLSRLSGTVEVHAGRDTAPTADRLHDPVFRQAGRLHDLVLRQADRTPDAPAVVDGAARWTYRDLRVWAEALARRIAGTGVGADDLVAVLLPRRPELVAAQLGVLLAGAAFLPLDPDLPPARLAAVLADSGARLVVTSTAFDQPVAPPRLLVEEIAVEADAGSTAAEAGSTPADGEPPRPPAVDPTGSGPEHLAWCVYTSGSTGRPKGVLVPHRPAVHAVTWHAESLGLSGADVVAHGLGLGFDANLAEIWPALTAGATVRLVPDEVRADPAALCAWWTRHGVTVAFLPAPLAELVFASPVPPPATLRTLVVGGSQLRRRPPAGFPATVVNAYGPTEAAIVTTAGPVAPDGTGPVDIGVPVAAHRLYVLDPHGRPVPPGAAGELHVGGDGLARGYLGRPAETAAAFPPDPYSTVKGARMYRTGDRVRVRGDGTLEFLGRLDDQVKIAGHRVEPGEAAAVLVRLPGVRQATVVARYDRGDEPYLAAYVVPAGDGEPPAAREARLTSALADRLPPYLVPRAWVLLDALPLGETGKVDPARLPAPVVAAGDQVPRAGVERLVHDAWCAELGVDRLPLDASFFAAGGHSLAAVRLANRLSGLLGTEVGVHRVLQAPGIRAMAATLTAPATVGADKVVDPDATTGDGIEESAPATYQQETMWHGQRRAPNPAAVHMPVRVALTGDLDVPALRAALDALVARHGALRTRLVGRDTLTQEVLPHRPLVVPLTDVPESEVDAWCVSTGREPFPDDGPWLRARLARLADDRHVLMLVVHHLNGDGWSIQQLLRELEEAYPALRSGRSLPGERGGFRYTGYARRQRDAGTPEPVRRYWREQLAGAPGSVSPPTDRLRPAKLSGDGDEYAFDLPAALADRVREGVGPSGSVLPVLASGWALLIGRLTGTADVVLAAPYAHRDTADVEPVVGLFTSVVPLRVPLAGAGSFAELVAGTDRVFLDALRHQPAPVGAIYAAVDPTWRPGEPPPVGTALFGWNPGIPSLSLPDLDTEVVDLGLACARRDLGVVFSPAGPVLRGVVEYSTDLYDRSTVARWCAEYVDLLTAALADPAGYRLPEVPTCGSA
ncbi:amino acid adenylation domain-containing protein [Micromonospora echinospora]|uniref:amino acid adenylation domain-containing protein n=1 Tax=Micromonospora echinospora TaxID=1877 RepID=UPI003A872C8A